MQTLQKSSLPLQMMHELRGKLSALWHQVSIKSALSQHQVFLILDFCNEPKPVTELMNLLKWKDRTKFRNKFIKPFIERGLLNMIFPDKPNSSLQKYSITKKGDELKKYLKQHENKTRNSIIT